MDCMAELAAIVNENGGAAGHFPKITFKLNVTQEQMMGFMMIWIMFHGSGSWKRTQKIWNC